LRLLISTDSVLIQLSIWSQARPLYSVMQCVNIPGVSVNIIFYFGEIVGDDMTIHKYLGRNSRIPGTTERFPSLDAALDFPLYFILEEVMKGFFESLSSTRPL